MEIFQPYAHAIAILALWGLMVQALAMLSIKGRTDDDRCACGTVKRDYSNPVYRRGRAFENAREASPLFIAGTIAAILAGANPLLVNILASVFLVGRVLMAFVHIRTENQNLRSMTFVIGWLSSIIMGIVALVAAIL